MFEWFKHQKNVPIDTKHTLKNFKKTLPTI